MQAQQVNGIGFFKAMFLLSGLISGEVLFFRYSSLSSVSGEVLTPFDSLVCSAESSPYRGPTFFSRRDDELSVLIDHVGCHIGQDLIDYAKKNDADYLLADYNEEITLVRSLLPEVLPRELLIPVLQDASFSIMITSQTAPPGVTGSPDALYQPASNTLRIIGDTDINKKQMRSILKNEFEHVATRLRNVELNNGKLLPRDASLPMIWPTMSPGSYESDATKLKEFKDSIEKGFARTAEVGSLITTSFNMLCEPQKRLLEAFKQALQRFEPEVLRQELPKTGGSKRLVEKLAKKLREKNVAALPGGKGELSLYVREIYTYSGSYVLKYTLNKDNHWRSKAQAFFSAISSWNDNVAKGQYKIFGLEHGVAELSSFLHELPGELTALLFPEWCQYFDDYHELDDGAYCRAIQV
jgi:hypothetical protein